MRVSGGALRSREIAVPKGRALRPTPGRVKEALFSIVAERVRDARVLDLYAGTGALGFEALSRGAAHVVFVEAHAPTAARIRATAQRLGVAGRTTVIVARAERVAKRLGGPFDILFADPPFADGPPSAAVAALRAAGALPPGALVVHERPPAGPPIEGEGLVRGRTARYGDVALDFIGVGDA